MGRMPNAQIMPMPVSFSIEGAQPVSAQCPTTTLLLYLAYTPKLETTTLEENGKQVTIGFGD